METALLIWRLAPLAMTPGGTDRGAVWILFLNADGTVASHQKISDTDGSFTGTLNDGDFFGESLTSAGDLDGNGVADLVVGAPLDDDGSLNGGAIWTLLLNADGTVASHQKTSDTAGQRDAHHRRSVRVVGGDV